MKTPPPSIHLCSNFWRSFRCFGAVAMLVVFTTSGAQAAARYWIGSGATDNWSDFSASGNWSLTDGGAASAGTPTAGNIVFTNVDTRSTTAVNNVVDTSYSVLTLGYVNVDSGTPVYQNTQINSGVTLTLAGADALGRFTVGAATAGTTRVNISGAGAFVINNASAPQGVHIGGQQSGGSGNSAILDMSGLATFTANFGTSGANSVFNIGPGVTTSAASSSRVELATTSSITTAVMNIGGVTGNFGENTLHLGSGSNTLNIGTINVGAANATGRGSGNLSFGSGTGSLTIRAADGSSRATMNVINSSFNDSTLLKGVVDFRGHSVNVLLGNLVVGARSAGGGGTHADTAFSFDTGTLDATAVYVGNSSGATASTANVQGTLNLGSLNSTGTSTLGSLTLSTNTNTGGNTSANSTQSTLNVAGGTHSVTGDIVAATSAASGQGTNQSAISTINLTGGTLTIGGNLVIGTGTGITKTVTLNLNGGTLDMTNGAIGSGTAAVTANFQSGTLRNLSQLNGGGTFTKTTAGTLTLDGTNTYTGSTLVSAGTLLIGGSATINASSGVTVNGGTLNYSSSTALTPTLTFTSGTLAGTNFSGKTLSIGANQTISPGNSTGTLVSGAQTWAESGTYTWEINDATGTAGGNGWDLLSISGALTITATSGTPFNLNVVSLASQVAGQAANFNSLMDGAWLIADATSAITTFDAGAFNLNLAGFQNAYNGVWSVALGGTGAFGGDSSQIYLTYSAIPEPSTTLLLTGGLMAIVLFRRRRA